MSLWSRIGNASALRLAPAALLAGVGLGAAPAPPKVPGPPLARLGYVERLVEQSAEKSPWRGAVEGSAFRTGERLRTGPDAMARLELPWMSLTLSPSALFSVPDDYVLSAVLEQGRALLHAEARDMLKLVTAEAEVRGRGRAVVRREGEATLVTSLAGRFQVEGAGRTVDLPAGKGTIVLSGRAPLPPLDLPDAPGDLWPGSDPVYVAPGEPIALRWAPGGPAYEVEVLPVGSDQVLIQRDVGAPPARLGIPWTGAFRWRVAARDPRGLEGRPSKEGLICVDAK